MRVMGLDVGTKTVGIAISDPSGEFGIERIKELVKEYGVTEFVVGYPKNMNNTVGPRGEASENYKKLLENAFNLPVTLWDERLTTMSAERMLIEADVSRKKRKKVIDKMAAVMILQGYLDSKSFK